MNSEKTKECPRCGAQVSTDASECLCGVVFDDRISKDIRTKLMKQNKKYTKHIIISIVCFVFLTIIGGFIYFQMTIPYYMLAPRILKIKSPTNESVAVLYTSGFVDRGTTLYMATSEDDMNNLKRVDDLDIEGLCFVNNVAWTKDGSVFVASTQEDSPSFTHCYDTRNNVSIIPNRKDKKQVSWGQSPQEIADLVKARKGLGSLILEIETKSRPMGYWEWRKFEETIKKRANKKNSE